MEIHFIWCSLIPCWTDKLLLHTIYYSGLWKCRTNYLLYNNGRLQQPTYFQEYLASPVMSLCMHHRQSRFHVASIKTTSLSCPLPIFTNYILPKIFDTRGYHFLQVNIICIPKQLPLKHVNSPLCQAMPATFKQNSHLVKLIQYVETCYIETRG